ncbi:OsmC family protein [Streptomyces chumphonensis]|uniref:OsmC family protein n=1 Tax=Streptomyces chumphonensis TaxID=1214925 RepID=UPI003D71F515
MSTSSESTLYTASVASAGDLVRIDSDGRTLPVSAPPALNSPDGAAWNPEQFYAAAVATCLHQTLGVVGSEMGADLGGSSVTAEVSLRHDGAMRFSFSTRVAVDLPGVDDDTRERVVREAMRSCPVATAVSTVETAAPN